MSLRSHAGQRLTAALTWSTSSCSLMINQRNVQVRRKHTLPPTPLRQAPFIFYFRPPCLSSAAAGTGCCCCRWVPASHRLLCTATPATCYRTYCLMSGCIICASSFALTWLSRSGERGPAAAQVGSPALQHHSCRFPWRKTAILQQRAGFPPQNHSLLTHKRPSLVKNACCDRQQMWRLSNIKSKLRYFRLQLTGASCWKLTRGYKI